MATPYRAAIAAAGICISTSIRRRKQRIWAALKAWLKLQGYEIRAAPRSLHPVAMRYGCPCSRVLLWLDQQGNLIRTREEITTEEALASFLSDLERNQRNWSEAKNRIESQLHATAAAAGGDAQAHDKAISNEGFYDLFKRGAIPEICEMARKYWREGLAVQAAT